jgi:hypothetical protein
VCADLTAPGVAERELRALAAAVREHPRATRRILVLTRDQLPARAEAGVDVQPAYQWLLDRE